MEHKTLPSKGRKSLQYRGNECLNCGHPLELADRYCPYCGQLNTTKRLSLGDFFSEFVFSIFTYDSRFRYTVKDLLFKPGTITRYYVDGKRFKYANPFRFFLSVSIVYFLASGIISFLENDPVNGMGDSVNLKELFYNINKDDKSEDDSLLTDISKVINDSIQEGDKSTIDSIIKAHTGEKKELYGYIAPAAMDTLDFGQRLYKRFDLFSDFYEVTAITNPIVALDSLKYPKTRVNIWIYERNLTLERIQRDPLRFVDYLANKIPFFLFFFTPLFALFFSLLYFERYPFKELLAMVDRSRYRLVNYLNKIPILGGILRYVFAVFIWSIKVKRKHTYMEHMVFIFHIFTFLFLVLLFCLIPDFLLGEDWFAAIFLLLIGPFYFYKALRNFYKQNRFLTIFKFFLLNFIFFSVGMTVAAFFFSITAVTY